MKKFLLVLLCLALGVMFSLSSEKQQLQAQQSYCPVKGIKEEGTGIVYCFDVGASTCYVPCDGGGGGKPAQPAPPIQTLEP